MNHLFKNENKIIKDNNNSQSNKIPAEIKLQIEIINKISK